MPLTDRLRVPSDLEIVPVADLAADVRAKLSFDKSDYALTLRNSRVHTRIVEASGIDLLREFENPSTVAEAVIRFAQTRGTSPGSALEEAYPLLKKLFDEGFLVEEGSLNAEGIRASAQRGDRISRWEVIAPIQVLDDSEVYVVRDGGDFASIKIERPDPSRQSMAAMLANEARILCTLNGTDAPRLVESGAHEGRRFNATEWIAGSGAEFHARELRYADDRDALLRLCRGTVAAYARLHAAGVIHGDVHQSNVLVDRSGKVWLVDFESSVEVGTRASKNGTDFRRNGVTFFFEPELAAAHLEGRPRPRASSAGEQYAVAALLYRFVTGAYYLDFSLERQALLRQIVSEVPQPFVARELTPWPELEAVLTRALEKSPADRYQSMEAFASALERVDAPLQRDRRERSADRNGAFFENFPASLESASLFSGSAGVACALYRRALARNSAADLAAADLWLTRAEQYSESCEATRSPFHGPSGLAALRALLANAQGDQTLARHATRSFIALAFDDKAGDVSPDLTLGDSGVLLAAALIGDVLSGDSPERRDLATFGARLLDRVWNELDERPPIASASDSTNLGIAHGWCGYAYAALRFCASFAHPRRSGVERRIFELADLGEPFRRGLRWRWNAGSMPGWCNGSAGFVQLFILAHRDLAHPRLLDAAVGAAWNAWEAGNGNGSLCCGEAGRAYALLALAAHLGNDAAWVTRARVLGERAADAALHSGEEPSSLFRGRLGSVLLGDDLERPELACFPFLEDEGWR